MEKITKLNYPNVKKWKDWMVSYKFGTLVFIPRGEVFENTNHLRRQYDPSSADYSMPHMTLTQPFSIAPTLNDVKRIQDVIDKFNVFEIETGPVISSPDKRLIWIDVNPKAPFKLLRNKLHDLGLFRTDLPFTEGFTPHMTISEFGNASENMIEALDAINNSYNLDSKSNLEVTWIIPDDTFVFSERYSFTSSSR